MRPAGIWGTFGRGTSRIVLGASLALVLAVLCFLALPAPAFAVEPPRLSEARSYEVMDQNGNVLFAQDAQEHMAMASITKVMTAMVALDSGRSLDGACTVVEGSYEEGAQLTGWKQGDAPTLRDLMMTMLVYSGNDSADDVAINVAGSTDAFVGLMNQKAAELGMGDTHFANPHGLEQDGHYSCAHDLVVMGRYALEHYPFIARAVMTRSYSCVVAGQERSFASTDDLMESYGGLCGIKTGAVEAGTTFLGSSRRHGLQLFSCVLGCQTHEGRFTDTAALMDWAYDEYLGQVHLARSSWPIRVAGWSLGFWGRVVVTPEWSVGGRCYRGQDVSYSTTLRGEGELSDLGGAFGYSSWTQGGRSVALSCLRASARPLRVPAFAPFELPLFFDVTQLMGA
ncbi:D-alanyl-D-alanine carboxypeptidase family protein [uncultured Olsenella sp.]|uniref:D-alanyl-D-alanine carboxypeptidase family protein n=1 Tax=uncultured Olsenella sp. TaxID=190764 RepID=UPI0026DC6C15|nr:D-alanyl-D-alanine carboxypeptidase family protein [uncultured Olsenella sp.]